MGVALMGQFALGTGAFLLLLDLEEQVFAQKEVDGLANWQRYGHYFLLLDLTEQLARLPPDASLPIFGSIPLFSHYFDEADEILDERLLLELIIFGVIWVRFVDGRGVLRFGGVSEGVEGHIDDGRVFDHDIGRILYILYR